MNRFTASRNAGFFRCRLARSSHWPSRLLLQNVLIKRLESGELQAVVGDFGLASSFPDGKTKLCTVGSPYWMSPECLKGLYYDQQSDVFSYGIVLCELLARVEADPDQLPRTDNFGLDYLAFTEMCGQNVVPEFLNLAFRCCTINPKSRPTFVDIVHILSYILADLQPAPALEQPTLASCAAKSEEQLPGLSVQASAPQHRKSMYQRLGGFFLCWILLLWKLCNQSCKKCSEQENDAYFGNCVTVIVSRWNGDSERKSNEFYLSVSKNVWELLIEP